MIPIARHLRSLALLHRACPHREWQIFFTAHSPYFASVLALMTTSRAPNFEASLAGTPCSFPLRQRKSIHPCGTQWFPIPTAAASDTPASPCCSFHTSPHPHLSPINWLDNAFYRINSFPPNGCIIRPFVWRRELPSQLFSCLYDCHRNLIKSSSPLKTVDRSWPGRDPEGCFRSVR